LHHQPAKLLATCKIPNYKIPQPAKFPNLQNSNLQNSQPAKFQPATCVLYLPLSGDFLQNLFSKSAQNLAGPGFPENMLRRHLGFKSFPKSAKTNNRILLDFWLCHEAKHCQI
jgi:hypothetical protein